jgi:hypothetical protein
VLSAYLTVGLYEVCSTVPLYTAWPSASELVNQSLRRLHPAYTQCRTPSVPIPYQPPALCSTDWAAVIIPATTLAGTSVLSASLWSGSDQATPKGRRRDCARRFIHPHLGTHAGLKHCGRTEGPWAACGDHLQRDSRMENASCPAPKPPHARHTRYRTVQTAVAVP